MERQYTNTHKWYASNTQNQIREDVINIQSDFSNSNFQSLSSFMLSTCLEQKQWMKKRIYLRYAIRHLNNDSALSMIKRITCNVH